MRNDYDADERDMDEDDYEGDGLRWMSVVVVLLVVLGFVSLAWYAYRSGGSSTVEGDVPTIEADAGPLKVAPSDPGGMDIPNQDKTVYEAITQGEHSGKTEVLTEAPEEPVITRDAVAHKEDKKETQVYRKPDDAAEQAATEPVVSGEDSEQQPSNDVAAAPVAGVAASEAPPQEEAEDTASGNAETTSSDAEVLATKATENVATEKEVAVKPESKPAPEAEPMAVSPQQPAPQVVNDLSAAQKAAREMKKSPAESAVKPVAASSGAAGVQLAASKSREDAEKSWGRLAAKFPDLLSGKSHAIIAAEVAGKGTYYRVRATGLSASSAADLCRQLKARGQDCMVVK